VLIPGTAHEWAATRSQQLRQEGKKEQKILLVRHTSGLQQGASSCARRAKKNKKYSSYGTRVGCNKEQAVAPGGKRLL